MRCSVLKVVVVLCLTGHLPVGWGQQESQWSLTEEALPRPRGAINIHEPSESNDMRWNISQLTPPEENRTTPLISDATIPASLGVEPAAYEQIAFTDGPHETIANMRRESFIITPQEDIITTPQEDIITTPQEDIITTPQEENLTTPQDFLTTPQDDILTTPQEDNVTTPLEDTVTTSQKDTITTLEGSAGIVLAPVLEDGRVPTRVYQLVICTCPSPTPDGCRRFLSDTRIDSKDDEYRDNKMAVADLSVVVHNVTCQKKDHRLMNFSEGQFFLRQRGDVVLKNAGYLDGLRVNDYCADLRPDKQRNTRWTVKICVPPPSVPRCCPDGQALRDGKCEDAPTPAILEPPMSADLNQPAIYWPVVNNHYNPLTCTSDPLKSIPLASESSYLLAVPTGIVHVWIPADGHVLRKYTYPPDLCVDGYVDSSGSVQYSANICYTNPEELHRKVCDGHTCVRKCCRDGEEMSEALYRCVPSNATTYTPRFTTPPNEYRIVNGKPLCPHQTLVNSSEVDSRGHIQYKGDALTAKEYCVDKFSDGRGKVEDKAMICIKETTAGWTKARHVALPTCQIISLLFLTLTVGCYGLVPTLLQGGGWYQLFHVLSLMLAYASMFSQSIFSRMWELTTCFAMAIVLQFGFLATFFWLNVLCFEVWRKIRSLNNLRAASVIPIWVYLLYAFGMPIAIGTLTVLMQLLAPHDVPGVVNPNLASSRCFFPDAVSILLYFYGPIAFLFACNIAFIAHTYWTYRKFEENSAILKKDNPESGHTKRTPMEHTHRKRDYISDFKQQFSLLVLMSTCWISEVLSYLIPPLEMWFATDLLNSLQGFFIFLIFIANRSKRKHLKRKFPLPFKIAHRIQEDIRQCCCQGSKETCLSPVSSLTSQISRKLSSSSVVSNLSTLSASLKFSISSFSVTLPDDEDIKKPSVFEPDSGIVTLSHSSLKVNIVSFHENGDAQC